MAAEGSAPGPRVTLLAPLGSRAFRLALTGRLVSMTGDAALSVTLAVLALDITQRPSGWGALLTASAVPRVILMLGGGLAVDRFRSRTVLLVSGLLQALVLMPLVPGAHFGQLELWHLYVSAVAFGV